MIVKKLWSDYQAASREAITRIFFISKCPYAKKELLSGKYR